MLTVLLELEVKRQQGPTESSEICHSWYVCPVQRGDTDEKEPAGRIRMEKWGGAVLEEVAAGRTRPRCEWMISFHHIPRKPATVSDKIFIRRTVEG